MALSAATSWIPVPAARRAMARILFRDFYAAVRGSHAHAGDRHGADPAQYRTVLRAECSYPCASLTAWSRQVLITYRAPGSRDYGSVGKVAGTASN